MCFLQLSRGGPHDLGVSGVKVSRPTLTGSRRPQGLPVCTAAGWWRWIDSSISDLCHVLSQCYDVTVPIRQETQDP